MAESKFAVSGVFGCRWKLVCVYVCLTGASLGVWLWVKGVCSGQGVWWWSGLSWRQVGLGAPMSWLR